MNAKVARIWVIFGLLISFVALVAVYQMSRFNELFERRVFFPAPIRFGVVPLQNSRFVVVDGDSISVYQVDKEGTVSRLSNVYVEQNLQRNRRDQ